MHPDLFRYFSISMIRHTLVVAVFASIFMNASINNQYQYQIDWISSHLFQLKYVTLLSECQILLIDVRCFVAIHLWANVKQMIATFRIYNNILLQIKRPHVDHISNFPFDFKL